jgi:hypothetical protein
MAAPSRLIPSRRALELELQEVGPEDAAHVSEAYARIWAPLGGGGRSGWTAQRWREEFSPPGVRA